jgi:phosphatidylglycerol---prolipoprotein diacylglyceryl transferase
MCPNIIIGSFDIHLWTLCMHISYIAAIACAVYFKPEDFSLSRMQLFLALVIFAMAGIFGSRLLGILILYMENPGLPMSVLIRDAGMAYLGAPLLGFISLWIFSAVTMTPFIENADYIAPFLMLSRAIGRLGCLLNGCCYGTPSGVPWAVPTVFAPGLRHPTQAYALIAALAIFITMFIQYKRLRRYKGAVFFGVITFYSFMRFFNEILRTDSIYIVGIIKLSMLTMAVLFTIGLTGLAISLKKSDEKALIFKSTFYYFLSSLLWITFIALGMLTAIRII